MEHSNKIAVDELSEVDSKLAEEISDISYILYEIELNEAAKLKRYRRVEEKFEDIEAIGIARACEILYSSKKCETPVYSKDMLDALIVECDTFLSGLYTQIENGTLLETIARGQMPAEYSAIGEAIRIIGAAEQTQEIRQRRKTKATKKRTQVESYAV